MNDARFDGPRTRDALDDASAESEVAPNHLDTTYAVPTRDWTRALRGRSTTSRMVHWFDEKGAVVRLITSSELDEDVRDS